MLRADVGSAKAVRIPEFPELVVNLCTSELAIFSEEDVLFSGAAVVVG